MKKKHYEKPSVEVVVLKQELMLPEASGKKSKRPDYGPAIEEEWGEG
jgi:hypothetical protein